MPSLQEPHTAASVNKLPIADFENMSLVYSTVTMREEAGPEMPVLPDAAVLAPMIKADETALPQSCP
ncbi:hypothetical protein SAMN05444159_6545 [Bradyrhizobium lablabi]|uniref:Uncharacterized protein n=1 Tax=Bradyrhizobium lablabi TaxID=722472 RepID=A0A1M7CPD3_9BRAD|nr:hypothetical protein SAMN05444159_6545 [Bradyrhizobium lablabi]